MKKIYLLIVFVGILFLPSIVKAQVIELSERELISKVCASYDSDIKYKGDKPCILLFHNGICPYAKQIGKLLEKISKSYKSKIYFYKVNVWNISDETFINYQLEGVPTTFFFRTDGIATYEQGILDEDTLLYGIEWLLRK